MMTSIQRAKHEMFHRARNFGIANRDAFPEESAGGKKFGQLASVVASIDEQLVRRAEARADARKVKVATRRAVVAHLKAVAATGRVAAEGESEPHPFRLPVRKSSVDVLSTARLFREEVERRKEKFLELGMLPTFPADFDAAIDGLARAVAVQQDSRGARGKARASIADALARGMKILAHLDVTVTNALSADPGRLGQWQGARKVDYPVRFRSGTPPASVTDDSTPVVASTSPADDDPPPQSPEEVLKVAS